MANTRVRFCAFPSVVRAGQKTTITIFPCDISRRFRQNFEYEVGVIGLHDDMVHYYTKDPLDLPYEIKDGTLTFEFDFSREQEYQISFCKKGEKEQKLSVYALNDDLYERRPLKGDLHTHSYYSDGSDGVAMVPANYREQGFDFFALTDHNRMFTSEFAKKSFENVNLGMHIIQGEEVHTPGSLVHIVNIGSKTSVCDKYVRDPKGYENAVDEIAKTLTHVPETYRRRVAMAHWACDEIHKAGGIAIFAHPFWKPYKYNVSDEFCDILFGENIFDAFELVGGSGTVACNNQLALWQHQCMLGHKLSPVGSSDSHNHSFDGTVFSRRFTYVFAKDNTTEAIQDAIKQGYCVAGELPIENDTDARFYGDFRLVKFANFMYKNYFNKTLDLCMAEGVLMQRYAMGDNVGDVLSALAPSVENFYKKFYGIDPAPTLARERTEYLDKLLDAQVNSGIITKGSNLELYPKKERRE